VNDNQDEFAGQGGSYLVGTDGKRKLVHRTQEPAPAGAAVDQAQAAPAAAVESLPPTKKGA
jgi:hypothetical protein